MKFVALTVVVSVLATQLETSSIWVGLATALLGVVWTVELFKNMKL